MLESWFEAWRVRGRRIVFQGDTTCAAYEELPAAVAVAQAALAAGNIGPGAVVAFPAEFSVRAAALLFALATRGSVAVPVDVGSDPGAVAARRQSARVRWWVSWDDAGQPEVCAAPMDAEPHPLVLDLIRRNRPGLVLFSSGSSGEPRAVLHDLAALLGRYVVRDRPELRVLPLMSPDHIGGIDMLLRGLAGGATLVVPATRMPEAIAGSLVAHGADVVAASPTLLNFLCVAGVARGAAGEACARVRVVAHGAEPLAPSLARRLRKVFPAAVLQMKFGTTETAVVRVRDREPGAADFRIDDPQVEWRVTDGELWLRTPSRALGYLNAEDAGRFAADGWYRTGDLVEQSADGWLRLQGRRSDIINVGGAKVLPADVESVLLELDDVAECVVRGEANALAGEIVVADIVWRGAGGVVEVLRAVRQHCQGRLAAHAVPVKVSLRAPETNRATSKKIRVARVASVTTAKSEGA